MSLISVMFMRVLPRSTYHTATPKAIGRWGGGYAGVGLSGLVVFMKPKLLIPGQYHPNWLPGLSKTLLVKFAWNPASESPSSAVKNEHGKSNQIVTEEYGCGQNEHDERDVPYPAGDNLRDRKCKV